MSTVPFSPTHPFSLDSCMINGWYYYLHGGIVMFNTKCCPILKTANIAPPSGKCAPAPTAGTGNDTTEEEYCLGASA